MTPQGSKDVDKVACALAMWNFNCNDNLGGNAIKGPRRQPQISSEDYEEARLLLTEYGTKKMASGEETQPFARPTLKRNQNHEDLLLTPTSIRGESLFKNK